MKTPRFALTFSFVPLLLMSLLFSGTAMAQPVPADIDYEVTVTELVPDPFVAGSVPTIDYLFTVTNISGINGEFDADFTLDLTLPGDGTVTLLSATPSANSFTDPTWNVGPLAAGASATLAVSLAVTSAAVEGSQVGASVTLATAGDNDTNDANDSAAETTDITREVNFTVTVIESVDPVIAGSGGGAANLSYTVTIINNGPSDASSVLQDDLYLNIETFLTSGVTVDSWTSSFGPPLADAKWFLTDGLAAGAQAEGTLNLIVSNAALPGVDVVGLEASVANSLESEGPDSSPIDSEYTSIVNSAEFNVTKVFADGSTDSVDVTFTCSSGTASAAGASISPGAGTSFTLDDFDAATSCVIEETVPGGYSAAYSADCSVDPVVSGSSYNCEITNSPSRATFRVTKTFADGNNVDEVTVFLDCNSGLILDQDKLLMDGESVEFVVTDYTDGFLSCTVTEDGSTGYSGEYNNITAGVINDESCDYPDITGVAEFECEITNSPDPVDIVVHKDWVIEGNADAVELEFGVDLYCQATGMTGPGAHDDGDDDWHGYDYSEGDDTFTWQIIPLFPSSSCYAVEYSVGSFAEVDNGCVDMVASAGSGAECTITNTVFFEGIPTLSQYGMALMALLMLGVGFVSFRRFS
jgi:hypothetical protein